MKLEIQFGDYEPDVFTVDSIEDAIKVYHANVSEKHYKNYGTVYNDDGTVLTRFYNPYEGIMIHSIQTDALESIRDDYGIPADVFRDMCKQWLADNPLP
jgi:hypothetical protein